MAGKPVEFHPEALAEYESAYDWYSDRSQSVASKFWQEITEAVEKIAATPQLTRQIFRAHAVLLLP